MHALGHARRRARASGSRRWPGTATATSRPTSACRAAGGCCTRSTCGCQLEELAFIIERRRRPGRSWSTRTSCRCSSRSGRRCPASSTSSCSAADAAGHVSFRRPVAYEDLIADEPTHYDRPLTRRADAERAVLHVRHHRAAQGRRATPTARPTCTRWPCRRAAGMAVGPGDCVLPQVPMFHANAWGMSHAAVGVGAKLVLLRRRARSRRRSSTCWPTERVTVAAGGADGVDRRRPTSSRARPTGCRRLRHIVCGGSQPPRALIERYRDDFGIPIIQAWGMTETSPLASMAWPQARMRDWDDEQVTEHGARPRPACRSRASRSASATTTAPRCPSTARPWAPCTCAGRGSPTATCTARAPRTSPTTAGSTPATSPSARRTATSSSPTGPRTSSSPAASGSPRSTWRPRSWRCPASSRRRWSPIPDPKWLERPLACVVVDAGTALTSTRCAPTSSSSGFARWQLPGPGRAHRRGAEDRGRQVRQEGLTRPVRDLSGWRAGGRSTGRSGSAVPGQKQGQVVAQTGTDNVS